MLMRSSQHPRHQLHHEDHRHEVHRHGCLEVLGHAEELLRCRRRLEAPRQAEELLRPVRTRWPMRQPHRRGAQVLPPHDPRTSGVRC